MTRFAPRAAAGRTHAYPCTFCGHPGRQILTDFSDTGDESGRHAKNVEAKKKKERKK